MTLKKTTGTRTRRPKAEIMRDRLLQKLPAMLDAAIEAYQQIAATSHSEDPKSFTAAQTGAKAALAHIDQIIKLAEAALEKKERPQDPQSGQVESLLQIARQALQKDEPEAGP